MFAVACVKDFGTVNISVDSCSSEHSGSKVRSWVTPDRLLHLSWSNLEVTTFCPTTSASYLRSTSCKISGAPPPLLPVLQALWRGGCLRPSWVAATPRGPNCKGAKGPPLILVPLVHSPPLETNPTFEGDRVTCIGRVFGNHFVCLSL